MATESNGTRTHEPSLRELTAELDGIRELLLSKVENLREIVDERDRLYKERDDARKTAVDAALAAAKEQTSASFAASKEAIVKAEDAQKEYNIRSNEFRGQLDDQAKLLISRVEVDSIVRNMEEKIDRVEKDVRSLRESRSEYSGGRVFKDDTRANIALLVGVIGLVAAIVTALLSGKV